MTWLAVAAVAVALAWHQQRWAQARPLAPVERAVTHHGWPAIFAKRTVTSWAPDRDKAWLRHPDAADYQFLSAGSLVFDLAVWGVLLASTAFVFQRRLSAPGGVLRWRLADLMGLFWVLAVLLAWAMQEIGHRGNHPGWHPWAWVVFRNTSWTLFVNGWVPWLVRLPLLLAVACTIQTAGWLLFRGMACALSWIGRARRPAVD